MSPRHCAPHSRGRSSFVALLFVLGVMGAVALMTTGSAASSPGPLWHGCRWPNVGSSFTERNLVHVLASAF